VATLCSGREHACDADEYSIAKSRLCAHSRRDRRNDIDFTQYDDDNLVLSDYIVGWPFRHLDHSESASLKRLSMCDLAPGAVHQQYGTLLDVALPFSRHTGRNGNGRAMHMPY
jgi:hypothetical protein